MTEKAELNNLSSGEMAKSSLDRMADLTRKILVVKKSELPKVKRKKRKKR